MSDMNKLRNVLNIEEVTAQKVIDCAWVIQAADFKHALDIIMQDRGITCNTDLESLRQFFDAFFESEAIHWYLDVDEDEDEETDKEDHRWDIVYPLGKYNWWHITIDKNNGILTGPYITGSGFWLEFSEKKEDVGYGQWMVEDCMDRMKIKEACANKECKRLCPDSFFFNLMGCGYLDDFNESGCKPDES